jgi:hypothetical protein
MDPGFWQIIQPYLSYVTPSGPVSRVLSLVALGCGGLTTLWNTGAVGSVMSYTKITLRRSVPKKRHSLSPLPLPAPGAPLVLGLPLHGLHSAHHRRH